MGVWGDAPSETFGVDSEATYGHSDHHLESGALLSCLRYKPAHAQRRVTVVLMSNTHTLRSGMHMRPHYSEDTDSYTAQLYFNTFVHF